MGHTAVRRGLQLALVVCLCGLIAGQVLGQPVLLGFVETGSMEPEIDAGDGFVAVPSALAGEPEVGDVVVFEAQEIEGGSLTTHRIVDERSEGYVTQGDANPVTDQDGDEPPVRDEQIVAHAWGPGESAVSIPHLGTVVMSVGAVLEGTQGWLASVFGTTFFLEPAGLAIVLFALSAALYARETVRERRERSRSSRLGRDDGPPPIDPHTICVVLAVLIVLVAMAAMVLPGGTHTYDVVSAEVDSDRAGVIQQGTSDELTYEIPNTGFVPVVSYVSSTDDRASVAEERSTVGPRDEAETTVTITAPEETGYYPTSVTEHRYLYVLPVSVIDTLYEGNPWLPTVVISGLLGAITYATGYLLLALDSSHARRTGRDRPRRYRTRG